jgi:hypothetical protein
MGVIRRLKKNLVLAFTGVQETTLAIADRVNRRVQEVKNSMEAADLEKKIEMDRALLGMEIHKQTDLTLNFLSKDPELKLLSEKIREGERKLAALENQPLFKDALTDFEQTLLHENFLMWDITISKEFPEIGKRIKDLSIPIDMKIVFIQKKGRADLVHGETRVESGDRIIFLCPRENSLNYLSYWTHS